MKVAGEMEIGKESTGKNGCLTDKMSPWKKMKGNNGYLPEQNGAPEKKTLCPHGFEMKVG